jgi:hypothetical protein
MAFMDTPGWSEGGLESFMPDLKPGYNVIR